MDFVTFPLEDLFDQYTNPAAMREAKAGPVVPAGVYTLQVTKTEGRIDGDRKQAHLSASVMVNGKKYTQTYFDVSWEPRKQGDRYDKKFRIWGQLVAALWPAETTDQHATHSIKEVLEKVLVQPIPAYLSESFRVAKPDGSGMGWTSVEGTDAAALREAGNEARNFVQNIARIK